MVITSYYSSKDVAWFHIWIQNTSVSQVPRQEFETLGIRKFPAEEAQRFFIYLVRSERMAKQRMLKTSFRADSYIEQLTPTQKLLYAYLLTNDYIDLSGIYEITFRRISYETWVAEEEVEQVMEKFQSDGKVFFCEGRIVIVNFIKNQNYKSPTIQKWIERSIDNVPNIVRQYLKENIPYIYRIEKLSYSIAPYLTLLNRITLPHSTLSESEWEKKSGVLNISDQQREELVWTYWEAVVARYEHKLINYINSKGDPYESHYATLLVWFDKDGIRPKPPDEKSVEKSNYTEMTDKQRAEAKWILNETKLKLRSKFNN